MANFDSDKITDGAPARGGVGLQSVSAVVEVSDALAAGDFVRFFRLPKGAVVLETFLDSTDLDTDGTPAIVLDLGTDETSSADIFIDGSTIGQAGGRDSIDALSSGYLCEDDVIVQAKVATVADAEAAGKIGCTVFYTMQTQDALDFAVA